MIFNSTFLLQKISKSSIR